MAEECAAEFVYGILGGGVAAGSVGSPTIAFFVAGGLSVASRAGMCGVSGHDEMADSPGTEWISRVVSGSPRWLLR
jgi:hypothetical protein